MTSLTIRNIPDSVMSKIKSLSEIEKRSINNEILVLLEKAIMKEMNLPNRPQISQDTQIAIWEKLTGKWKDSRKTKTIIEDIYSARTFGRNYDFD